MTQDNQRIKTLLIDLDDTVYPASSGFWPVIRERLDRYLHEYMGFSKDIIPELREHLYSKYGTTLRGLQAEYKVDTEDYLSFVRNVPIEDHLTVQPELYNTLASYSQSKFIFTNADKKYAERVLRSLGIDELFKGIIDIHTIAPYCKPHPEAYRIALEFIGETEPETCLFIDDSPRNVHAAKSFGISAILVGKEPVDGLPTIKQLNDLPQVFPPLTVL